MSADEFCSFIGFHDIFFEFTIVIVGNLQKRHHKWSFWVRILVHETLDKVDEQMPYIDKSIGTILSEYAKKYAKKDNDTR